MGRDNSSYISRVSDGIQTDRRARRNRKNNKKLHRKQKKNVTQKKKKITGNMELHEKKSQKMNQPNKCPTPMEQQFMGDVETEGKDGKKKEKETEL